MARAGCALEASGVSGDGRFGKQDCRYVVDGDVYICPAGNRLTIGH